MSTDAPVITVGMTMEEVTRLLGAPSQKMGGGELLSMAAGVSGSASAMSQMMSRTFCVYDRPAGKYELVFAGGRVIQVHSQPSQK